MNNEIEQRVLEAIDIDGLVAFLCELIAIPSLDGQAAEVAVQQHVADWMRRNGLAVDLWELDFASLRQRIFRRFTDFDLVCPKVLAHDCGMNNILGV